MSFEEDKTVFYLLNLLDICFENCSHGPHSEIASHGCGRILQDQLRKGLGAARDTGRRAMGRESTEA